MPCYFPIQASFTVKDGKKIIVPDPVNQERFNSGKSLRRWDDSDGNLSLPCGRCMGCRLERSRQWALRCLHESKMYEQNCFVTLTFSDDSIIKMCPNGSLVRKHLQDFIKRLRFYFVPPCPDGFDKEEWKKEFCIRYFYCGEYGPKLDRPHYHLCLFNFDFPDKVLWKNSKTGVYYVSDCLAELWPFGFSTVCDFSYETASYVARYCTKKISGKDADDHYNGRLPEFAGMSLKPGLGKPWLDKYGKTDVFPHDNIIVKGVPCKPPRYYDKVLEREDPERFQEIKELRVANGEKRKDDNTYSRLQVKQKCLVAKTKLLLRRFENGS